MSVNCAGVVSVLIAAEGFTGLPQALIAMLQNTRGWQQESAPHSTGFHQSAIPRHRASGARDSRSHGGPIEADAGLFAASGRILLLMEPVMFVIH